MNLGEKLLNYIKDYLNKRYFLLWLKLVLKQTSWIEEEIPFFPFRLTEWLDSYLKPDMHVFEYGSGGSTLFFARKVKTIVTVEHDARWYQFLAGILKRNNIHNCEYLLFKPEFEPITDRLSHETIAKDSETGKSYFAMVDHCKKIQYASNRNMNRYITSIDAYPDTHFDLVVVDGRARNLCTKHATPKVRPGGILILDDSSRKRYLPSVTLLNKYPKQEFYGLGAGFDQTTTIWKIDSKYSV